jgi:integrase
VSNTPSGSDHHHPLSEKGQVMAEISVSCLRRDGDTFYQMQYRDPVTGLKVRRSTKCQKRREAERVAAKWEKDLREGHVVTGGRMAWDEFRRSYEDHAAGGLAEATQKRISGVFNVLEQTIHPRVLGDLTREGLDRHASSLRAGRRSESTIKSHLAHIRAALSWAVERGYLTVVPRIPKVHRAKTLKVMRGRPITTEEFERMLAQVPNVIRKPNLGRRREKPPADQARVPGWRFLLRGLWWSGLRISEALDLSWDDETRLLVELSYQRPMLRIPAGKEKGHKDRLLPIAPEFAEFLLEIPPAKRRGFVFDPRPMLERDGRLRQQQVERVIAQIGRAANVVVDRGRTATAHDLRRSFGLRWSARVMPQILMELMRHETIDTTMKYYVGRNAEATAEVLYAALDRDAPKTAPKTRIGL